MEKQYCQKQNYMTRTSEILREAISSEFSDCDLRKFVLPLLPLKHKQNKSFVDFILPNGVVSRLLTAVKREQSETDEPNLLKSIYSVKETTASWNIPLESVDFCNGVVHFKVNAASLQRQLISEILRKDSVKENTLPLLKKGTIVCCVPESISQIRTLCLASCMKNVSNTSVAYSFKYIFVSKTSSSNPLTSLLESFNISSSDVVVSGNPGFSIKSLSLSTLKDCLLFKENDDVPYFCFDKVALEKLKCGSCLSMYKSVMNTKLRLSDSVLQCLATIRYVASTPNNSQPVQFRFIACQSDSIFLSQLKVALLLFQQFQPNQTASKESHSTSNSLNCICNLLSSGLDLIHGPITTTKTDVSLDQLLSKYSEDIKSSFEAKYGTDSTWIPMVDIIAKSVLKLDVFSVSLTSPIHLDLDSSHVSSVFILYNYSRLSCLLKKFHEGVKSGLYPELPDIENVDFALLKEMEERQLIDYLWELGSSPTEYLDSQKLQYHSLIVFLKKLCKTLSCYYSRHHILGNSLPHLYPTMFARLYLVRSVKSVMLSVLKLLDIQPVEQM